MPARCAGGVVFTRIQGTQRFLSLREEDLEYRFPGLLDSILKAYESSNGRIGIELSEADR